MGDLDVIADILRDIDAHADPKTAGLLKQILQDAWGSKTRIEAELTLALAQMESNTQLIADLRAQAVELERRIRLAEGRALAVGSIPVAEPQERPHKEAP